MTRISHSFEHVGTSVDNRRGAILTLGTIRGGRIRDAGISGCWFRGGERVLLGFEAKARRRVQEGLVGGVDRCQDGAVVGCTRSRMTCLGKKNPTVNVILGKY